MYYPYRAVMNLNVPAIMRFGMMVVGQLDLRYSPCHDMSVVRRIFEVSPPRYFRLRNINDPVTNAWNVVQDMLFNNMAFREQVLANYEMAVKPNIERHKAYNRELEELTSLSIPFEFSLDALDELTDAYAIYRRLNEAERQFYLLGLNPVYAYVIQSMDHMEQLYPDLIEQDLRNVPNRVYNSMGLGRYELMENEFGVLFPYIHLVNRAKLLTANYDEMAVYEQLASEPVPDLGYML
jgi:hypothetical protein